MDRDDEGQKLFSELDDVGLEMKLERERERDDDEAWDWDEAWVLDEA